MAERAEKLGQHKLTLILASILHSSNVTMYM